ncbi:MAG: S16 family serine protease, partial [Deltaproteobacteria bacterium]
KIGMDFRGDPSSALLEVLDPEQNYAFSDHYLNVPFDLSKVMFITTANMEDPIPEPLLDRMEVLNLPGYTEEEKLVIAKKYIVPRQVKEHGLTKKLITLEDEALKMVISGFTREAGLRNLEREVASLCRKVAKKVASGNKKSTTINTTNLHDFLGIQKYLPEAEQETDEIGVATGLAWTPVGGEILYIEATTMNGKGQLTLTGHLGDIMKESAHAALSYTRSRAKLFNLPADFYKDIDIHIHVPSGAIPKDGPSAGITMATALISAVTKTPVCRDVAMTGEITLRGRVLPIGGVKEKCLAALRAKIFKIIIPERNKKDLEDIPKDIRAQLTFIPVRHMDDVLKVVFRKKAKAPPKKSPKKAAKGARAVKRKNQVRP